jgi:hypothetical protein
LKRLRKRLEVLKQIHDAPNIYAFLVVEVVRRRKFSSTFTEVGNYFFLSGSTSITHLKKEGFFYKNMNPKMLKLLSAFLKRFILNNDKVLLFQTI